MHIGVDKKSGLTRHLVGTSANAHDVTVTSRLLSGEEETVQALADILARGNGKRS